MITLQIVAPHFKHDCTLCNFVGQLPHADIYTCADSIIVRTGNEGPDYASLPLSIARAIPEYAVPVVMADNFIRCPE